MSKEEIKIKLHSLAKITNNGDSVSIERMFDTEADFILKLIEIEKRKYALGVLQEFQTKMHGKYNIDFYSDYVYQLQQQINQLENKLK